MTGLGAEALLPCSPRSDRAGRDRLEILTALINAPSFDPMFRPDVIDVPADHAVYRWVCVVEQCERPRTGSTDMCGQHQLQWAEAKPRGLGKAAFLLSANGFRRHVRVEERPCRICPDRPVARTELQLCQSHSQRWLRHKHAAGEHAQFTAWCTEQTPLPGYGTCTVSVCTGRASSPLRLCARHESRYHRDGRPGGAALPERWWHRFEQHSQAVPISYINEKAFRRWLEATPALTLGGQINLLGLRPLVATELKWGLFVSTRRPRPQRRDLGWIRSVVTACRAHNLDSLVGYEPGEDCPDMAATIIKQIQAELRLVYFTPADTREAGFLETDHFGVRFPHRGSTVDLTGIPQRWLRDLLWDHLAELLQSPRCPRSGGTVDALRRAAVELGAFLELEAPEGGHDPRLLDAQHMRRFVADQRHREREALPSLALKRSDGSASTVSETTRSIVFNAARKLLRTALDSGAADRIGLSREFIVAAPAAGKTTGRVPRRPFPDDVARALADQDNLARLATHDPFDRGLRAIWETTVLTGRRVGEVIAVRWDCLGRYGGLPMFWHDQTKVGNYDAAIRIPERLFDLLSERQRKTMDAFVADHGRRPSDAERPRMALFPTTRLNPDASMPLSYQWFHSRFKAWIDELDLGPWVPHQARHTLATNLLRAGASLTHIRTYLGQVSDRMAEHYVHLSHTDLERVLQHVWVAGPGTANPGELLTTNTTPLSPQHAQAMAIDLSRRSTPAEGGFCTFQPVVDGGACPWKLDCHNCDKFVLSGADLLYWRRKREQWRQLAEGAPDDATADYLHRYFQPTARAIDGLEQALAGLGLLDQALDMDLRKPQDYFHRIWSTAFRATDLAATGTVIITDDEESCA